MRSFFILPLVSALITYDSNIITKFAYQYSGGSSCFAPNEFQQTVIYSDIFAKPPKILLQTELLDIIHLKMNFTVEIITVTTEYFIIHLKCIYASVFGIVFRWQAIDDERIQIINEFNMNSFQNKTYSHFNTNVEKALISLINFSFQGPVQFDLLIGELTKTNVSVIITDPNNKYSNLLMLGYQVILGIEEAISQFNMINTTAVYTSPHYNFQDSSWFITPFLGFSYDLLDNIRLNKTYYTDSSTTWYKIHTFLLSIVQQFLFLFFLSLQILHQFLYLQLINDQFNLQIIIYDLNIYKSNIIYNFYFIRFICIQTNQYDYYQSNQKQKKSIPIFEWMIQLIFIISRQSILCSLKSLACLDKVLTYSEIFDISYYTTIYTALECRTIRITQIKEKQTDFRNPFEVEIIETTQVFNNLDTYPLIIDKNYQQINLKIYSRCFTTKSIVSYFNKYNGYYQFKHNCYGAINTINYSVRLLPTIQAHQELIQRD